MCYRAVGMFELDVELSSCTHNRHETLSHIAVDDRPVRQTLLRCVAVLVYDPTMNSHSSAMDCKARFPLPELTARVDG